MIALLAATRVFNISLFIAIPAMALATVLPFLTAFRAYRSITKDVAQIKAT
jgi:hypothetical protein